MATLAESLVSSSSRPLLVRKRPDLLARRHFYQGRPSWVVKDPVGLNYFRFHEEEYAVLQMLDGTMSMEEIKEEFERRFAPQKTTFEELQQFVGTLHRGGLLVSDAPGQGEQLVKRGREKTRKKRLAALASILWFRFRGIDPEGILNFLYPWCRWFFTKTALFVCVLLAVGALLLVGTQFETFQARLPTFQQFFGPQNWLLLACVLMVTKILHEFGHGLSCKHFGGECHEIGVMLLVGTPALYCNVSDSWMLPSKWQRAAIGAAGMYVEMVLAAIATFLWWYSEPGTVFNSVCLGVMFICSVSTLMFNGNPLLRFDGYYILSDLMEVPNMRQKATTVLRRLLVGLCLGIELPDDPFLPRRRRIFFAIYTVASVVYRWMVLYFILLFLNRVLEPYGLKVLGQIMAMVSIVGLVIEPSVRLVKFFHVPGRMSQVKALNVLGTIVVVGGLVAAILYVPLPRHLRSGCELRPVAAPSIYVQTPGYLHEVLVKPGEPVERGQVLARLKNPELDLAEQRLKAQIIEQETQLASLRKRRFRDPQALAAIAATQENIKSLQEQLVETQKHRRRLEIKAPIAGTVLPPPKRPQQRMPEGELHAWSGSPLDEKNRGARLDESVLLCQIGDPTKLEAVLMVDQSDIEYVAEEQELELMLDAFPGRELDSKIKEIARRDRRLPQDQQMQQMAQQQQFGTPQVLYQARAPLGETELPTRMGMKGRAKIYVGQETLGRRISRWFSRTMNFEM